MRRPLYRTRKRRGVLMLVVLSVLLMFVLMALTYLMVASQYSSGSQTSARLEQSGDDPHSELDEVLYQLVRDTVNPNSVMQGHSLLADLYGNDGFIGELAADPNGVSNPPFSATYPGGDHVYQGATNGQFIDLWMSQDPNDIQDTLGRPIYDASSYPGLFDIDRDGMADVPHPTSGFYNGRLLTIISGPAAGSTARIVRYDANNDRNQFRFRVMFLAETNDRPIRASELKLKTRFIVNGRPFSGTGVGYRSGNRSADGKLDLHDDADNHPYALLCNPVDIPELRNGGAAHIGGADEGYDAADYQNVFLAAMDPNPTAFMHDNPSKRVNPSFHRRALINYWMNAPNSPLVVNPPNSDEYRQFLSKLTGRPTNAAFSSNNPAFDPVNGPWDVDNDGDGVPDSVWIDAGLPIKTAKDGRRYKPLFAILCTDLDGRLNLNAHSNRAEAELLNTPTLQHATLADGTTKTDQLPRGYGIGPPEISLLGLFDGTKELKKLLENGRYGDGKPGNGVTADDTEASVQFYEYPKNYWDFSGQNDLSSFNSPPDLLGIAAFGINAYGQPAFSRPSPTDLNKSMRSDSEYEINFSLSAPRGNVSEFARDRLFSAAEMEFLARLYDADHDLLPPRIRDLGSLPFIVKHRNIMTTDQYDLPAPAIMTTEDLRQQDNLNFPMHITELLRARLIKNGMSEDEISRQIELMMSPDLVQGLRMDINRPIGNAKDDNNNMIVDEPEEAEAINDGLDNDGDGQVDEPDEAEAISGEEYLDPNVPILIDHNNDGLIDSNDRFARYRLARHLYVLLMILRDNSNDIDFDSPLFDSSNDPSDTATGLAQWAINAVDFRDADSIMTAFEFDANPFNGWRVNGDPETDGINDGRDNDGDGQVDEPDEADDPNDRKVVWGCERPELLITETLAFHDRHTEDTDKEPDNPNDPSDTAATTQDGDTDFDQVELPRGACFVELYNPWVGDARVPGELYFDEMGDVDPDDPGRWYDGVILKKKSRDADNEGLRSPIWRMVIVKDKDHKNMDPDSPSRLISDDIERSVYFVDSVPDSLQHGDVTYQAADKVHTVVPGKFAVIGPEGQTDPGNPGKYTTYLGERSDSNLAATRRIELYPRLDPSEINTNDTVLVESNVNDSVSWSAGHRPTAVVIKPVSSSKNFNVSEPPDGYTYDPVWDPADPNSALDEPLDQTRDDLGDDFVNNALMDDKTIENFRVIHLQRLANPLKAYHQDTNPYLTIDSAFINLTVFNGASSASDGAVPDKKFVTVQRGDWDWDEVTNTLWKSEIAKVWSGNAVVGDLIPDYSENKTMPEPGYAGAGTEHFFNFDLMHTLGFLNHGYGPPNSNANLPEAPQSTDPFPWLTWLNRPYVSQYELMQVPKTSSSRLTAMFSLFNPNKTNVNPYTGASDDDEHQPFGHLLNFFHTNSNGAKLFRIFEYTRVPSQFAGTTVRLDPTTFRATSDGAGTGTELFHPPFNEVSLYRDPGRVNINTIYSEVVWDGIRNKRWDPISGAPITHPLPEFSELVRSRRGYGGGDGDVFALDLDLDLTPPQPTFFANPFRPSGAYRRAPPDTFIPDDEIDVTLLRRADVSDLNSIPLMYNNSSDGNNEVDRNSYFRYQSVQRLENLVTNRSNVFAIWITVGYFEVESQGLGPELGTDTGEIKRHRAFYMVDRTIPVAFQPGQNHNVDRAIILRRFME